MIEILKAHHFFSDKQITSCELTAQQGYCNENYSVVAGGVKYVVRKLLREDIDRDFEWEVHGLVYKKGITAEPLAFDKEQGFMIFSFLEGEHIYTLDEQTLKLLAHTLKKLHSIIIDTKPIVLQIKTQTKEVCKAFQVIDKYPKEYVLCHNDLNPENIFFADDVKLIDFEYAGVHDRYFDLACVCVEFSLDETSQTRFMDTYFSSVYSIDKLEAYKIIYKTLCMEWFKTYA